MQNLKTIKRFTSLFLAFAMWFWQFSFAQKPSTKATLTARKAALKAAPKVVLTAPRAAPEEVPSCLYLLARPTLSLGQVVTFLKEKNPDLPEAYARKIARIYIAESRIESINPAVAVAQMALETGFLRFGGTVDKKQNNFAGMGCVNTSTPGNRFKTILEGIRAHIQHLKTYASLAKLRKPCVDPRRKLVEESKNFGKVKTVQGLAGTWAADEKYGEKLERLTFELLRTQAAPDPAASLPKQPPNHRKKPLQTQANTL
ncbi:MAG: glucosaminidase domain-containing protein [Puniceicoccales bacterium]|jgi:hypothetical protein|nr:glucosaminidase domain-containing protein [Puniceicoccales bacterium]